LEGDPAALRNVLGLEEKKGFTDGAVVGGLDTYLLKYLQAIGAGSSHPVSKLVRALPPGGYRALHKVQRARVVQALRRAVENGPGRTGGAGSRAAPPATPPAPPPPAPKPATKKSTKSAPSVSPGATLDSRLSALGVGKADSDRFARLRRPVLTILDLLFAFPRDHLDYSEMRPIAQLQYGELQTVVGTVFSSTERQIGRQRRKATEVIINDSTASLKVVWWNQPWIARRFRPGMKVALSGKVTEFGGRLQMDGPEIEPVDEEMLSSRRLVPVYHSTEKLQQATIRGAVQRALDALAESVPDALPPDVRRRLGLLPASEAIRQAHFPDSDEHGAAARRRFAFEELLCIEIGVVRRRREWQSTAGAPGLTLDDPVLDGYVQSLPFQLTRDQQNAIAEVLDDIADETPMTRLLEGDVGCGKTVVAAAALLGAVSSGHQGAIMAPTEILAEQHFRTLTGIYNPGAAIEHEDARLWSDHRAPGYVPLTPPYLSRPLGIALLTGSLKQSEKTDTLRAIASGEVGIVIGTHALLQESVEFKSLALAVIDEQHRFGVDQRSILRAKGGSPHVLVMTATPIPRTLALTVYGDLDISVIKEMPPGRPPVKTFRVLPYRRDEAFNVARKQIAEGRQAYVICPLVEESEAIEARAAVQEFERLSHDEFAQQRVGLLHGRMSGKEKDAVMLAFRDHEIDVLVSTAVVEVGVDVPNATVILIEGAERFGLSQLHQFRGRVRRSEKQAYCFLLTENPSPESDERLKAMETMDNGFELAERDFELRGPGEYFGTRQSGIPDLRVANLGDLALVKTARQEAESILDQDPELDRPEHRALAAQVAALWDRVTTSEIS
jgi:ATP-dependent DNA helicase RecG